MIRQSGVKRKALEGGDGDGAAGYAGEGAGDLSLAQRAMWTPLEDEVWGSTASVPYLPWPTNCQYLSPLFPLRHLPLPLSIPFLYTVSPFSSVQPSLLYHLSPLHWAASTLTPARACTARVCPPSPFLLGPPGPPRARDLPGTSMQVPIRL